MATISSNGIKLIKDFEGCRLSAYRDEVGVWTIGYGITNADKSITGKTICSGLVITASTAEKWLRDSLNKKYIPLVMKYDDRYHWNQNEIDALTSFCFNIGSIDQLTANGTRSREVIADKILEYNKAGGTVYNGLVRRRKAERELFLKEAKKEKTIEDYLKERKKGVNYFSTIKNNDVNDISEFLHNRGFGAGGKNLSKIASENCESEEVKDALFKLAKKGLLVKPDDLNKL